MFQEGEPAPADPSLRRHAIFNINAVLLFILYDRMNGSYRSSSKVCSSQLRPRLEFLLCCCVVVALNKVKYAFPFKLGIRSIKW